MIRPTQCMFNRDRTGNKINQTRRNKKRRNRRIIRIKNRLNTLLAKNTGKSVEEVERDTERNNWMFAEEAKEYGIIDHIIEDKA